jgi:hypothetical protein
MLLTLETSLRTVFTVYGAFWLTVLVVLFLAVGALLKRRDRPSGHH